MGASAARRPGQGLCFAPNNQALEYNADHWQLHTASLAPMLLYIAE